MNWSLIAGPGARIAELKAYLLPDCAGGISVRLVDLDHLGALLDLEGGVGKLLLSSDEISIEDVGLLRHWLRKERGFELVLCGSDPSRRAVRRLMQDGAGRWLQWPPDIEELRELMRSPQAGGAPTSAGRAPTQGTAARAPTERQEDELETVEIPPAPRRAPADPWTSPARGSSTELERIEAILGGQAGGPGATGPGASANPSGTALGDVSARAREPERFASPSRTEREPTDEYERAAARAARPLTFTPPAEPHAPSGDDEPVDAPDPGPPSRHLLAPNPRRPEEIFARALEAQPGPAMPRAPEHAPEPAPPRAAPAAPPAPPTATPPAATPPEAAAPRAASTTPLLRGTALPAPYFRDQVADLADMAQRIELDLAGVRDSAIDAGADSVLEPALEHLAQDVARLLQFTRTLGYLVAPPPAGNQGFDLGELVELFVATARGNGADGPRFLLRKDGVARVTSDRQLLSQALDAFFYVARSAAQPGEVVRVHVRLEAEPAAATLGIEFPVGPLAGLDPARIVEPYALRRTLPELGANALLAASGIVRGQNGDVELVRVGAGHLEWRVRLPLAGSTPDGGPRGAPRADDPFA